MIKITLVSLASFFFSPLLYGASHVALTENQAPPESTSAQILHCYKKLLENDVVGEGFGPNGTFLVPPDINVHRTTQDPLYVFNFEKGEATVKEASVDDFAFGKEAVLNTGEHRMKIGHSIGVNSSSSCRQNPSFRMREFYPSEKDPKDAVNVVLKPVADKKKAEEQGISLLKDLIQGSVGFVTYVSIKKVPSNLKAKRSNIVEALRACRPLYVNTAGLNVAAIDRAIGIYDNPNDLKMK